MITTFTRLAPVATREQMNAGAGVLNGVDIFLTNPAIRNGPSADSHRGRVVGCSSTPIAQRRRPSIPREAWPDLVRQKDAGVPVQELAKRWDVSPITVWHTIQKTRQQGDSADVGRPSSC